MVQQGVDALHIGDEEEVQGGDADEHPGAEEPGEEGDGVVCLAEALGCSGVSGGEECVRGWVGVGDRKERREGGRGGGGGAGFLSSFTYDAVVEVGAREDGGDGFRAQDTAAQLCWVCVVL